jgi:putative acetyltransferase
MMSAPFQLRPYRSEDEDAAIALWLETWQQAYPSINFAARLAWWRRRWRSELVPNAAIVVAEQAGALIGFVTIDASGYLDQLVVAPDHWGSTLANALIDEAKRLSPDRITLLVNTDNIRAIRFYERNGFDHAGEDVNPTSGRPVLKMEWKP